MTATRTADLINAQDATLYGIEGEFRAELGRGFYALGAFGWMDGEYDEFIVEDNQIVDFQEVIVTRDLSDTEVVRGSPYTYSIAIGKTQVLVSGGTVNAQAGWAFRGRLFNTLDTVRASRQGKYGLLDARISWAMAKRADGRFPVGHEPAGPPLLSHRGGPLVRRQPLRHHHQVLGRAAPVRLGGELSNGPLV